MGIFQIPIKTKIELRLYCDIHSEGYDVVVNDVVCGYVRVRWGSMDVYMLSKAGVFNRILERSLEAGEFRGCFVDEEQREVFLYQAKEAIRTWLEENK